MEKDNSSKEENVELVKSQNKKCFIITPIGNENDPIRRHIDGLIDECIIPVLEEGYEYRVTVAHRISKPGSINNQVIQEIYESELVIANLTNLNPNVMYELAFRHALKKPVIIIIEEEWKNKIPFDLVTERAIFYNNDFQGAINLKNELRQKIEAIKNLKEEDIDNPIYAGLAKLKQTENVIKNIKNIDEKEITGFQYIINQLEEIKSELAVVKVSERKIYSDRAFENEIIKIKFSIRCDNSESTDTLKRRIAELERSIDYCSTKYNCPVLSKQKNTSYIIAEMCGKNLNNCIDTINLNNKCTSEIMSRKVMF